jgi:hypothetical protein
MGPPVGRALGPPAEPTRKHPPPAPEARRRRTPAPPQPSNDTARPAPRDQRAQATAGTDPRPTAARSEFLPPTANHAGSRRGDPLPRRLEEIAQSHRRRTRSGRNIPHWARRLDLAVLLLVRAITGERPEPQTPHRLTLGQWRSRRGRPTAQLLRLSRPDVAREGRGGEPNGHFFKKPYLAETESQQTFLKLEPDPECFRTVLCICFISSRVSDL